MHCMSLSCNSILYLNNLSKLSYFLLRIKFWFELPSIYQYGSYHLVEISEQIQWLQQYG